MKVFVGGATGRVGQKLTEILAKEGHEVVAASRHPLPATQDNVIPVEFDFHDDVAAMMPKLEGCDAVYFVAGSRGKDLLQTDAFGAVKLMKAADAQSINRFIMLSSMFTLEPEKWAQEPGIADITDYNIAKMFADHWLAQTDLDWTIVQAGLLREEDPTGKIVINPDHEGPVAIPDIASTLAAVLPMPTTYRQVIRVKNGETPIADALAAV